MPLWSEKIFEIISILLNLLRLALCPSMWSILENVPCALERNVYSYIFGCNVLKISMESNFSIVSFRISVPLFIFCLLDLSMDVRGVLKSPTNGVPIMAQWLTNLTRNHEVAGSIPGLAQRVGDPALP